MYRFSYISGSKNREALKVEYKVIDGIVEAEFCPSEKHQSYKNIVHGGLLAATMDDAMAYAINITGETAVTAKIEIRFRKPIRPNDKVTISAKIEEYVKSVYYTSAKITNPVNVIMADAKAIFMKQVKG